MGRLPAVSAQHFNKSKYYRFVVVDDNFCYTYMIYAYILLQSYNNGDGDKRHENKELTHNFEHLYIIHIIFLQ